MISKYIYILVLLIANNFVLGQNYIVTYSHKINFDNVDFKEIKAKFYDFYMNKDQSLYIENKELKDNDVNKNIPGEINLTKERNNSQKIFYLTKNNGDFYMNRYIGNVDNYVVKDVFKHNWKIENEFKIILNLNCQKATTNFRGRNYTAWFSNDIKSSFGPWKMNGLPGLILEVYDDQNFFRIDAIDIAKESLDINDLIRDYDLSNIITIEEYNLKSEEYSQKMLEKVRQINPKFKMDEKCESCNKSLEIFKDE